MDRLTVNAQGPAIRQDRVAWIDRAKGIGILLVVVAHGWRGLIDNGLMQWTPGLRNIDYVVYSFHMPLFFFLSGLTSASLSRGRKLYLLSKIRTVAYPYFLWSTLVGLILIAAGQNANTRFTWADLLRLPWLPIQQFWFLHALFFSQMLRVVISRNDVLLVVCGILYTISILFMDQVSTISVLFHFSLFFALGVFFSGSVETLRRGHLWVYGILFAALAYGGLATGRFYLDLVFLPAAIAGIMLTSRASMALGEWPGAVLAGLGRMSMTIYVAHIVAMSGVRVFLTKLGFGGGEWAYLLVCVVAGLALPIAMHLTLERLGALWILGLGRRGAGNAPRRAGAQGEVSTGQALG